MVPGGAGACLRPRAASPALDDLLSAVLALQEIGADTFVGRRPAESIDRIYGGETLAQGIRAAANTVPTQRHMHSCHINFLRLGDPTSEVVCAVERLRDSAQFSTRQVRVTQGPRLIAMLQASFQPEHAGVVHGQPPREPLDSLPAPEDLASREELLEARFGADLPQLANVQWAMDIRYIDRAPWAIAADPRPANRMWVRADGVLGEDPHEHACVLAYASDLTMFEPVLYPHADGPYALSWEAMNRGVYRGASLEHNIWLHRPFRADEWLLHEHESTVAAGSRGLSTGRYFNRKGELVASVAQEVAIMVEPGTLTAHA